MGDTTAADTPSSVASGTAGAASRLAGTATRLTVPDRPAMTGPQATWAAAGTASASAAPAGQPRRRSASRQGGGRRSSPAVASVDSANPGSAASSGSYRMRPATAAPSAGNAARD